MNIAKSAILVLNMNSLSKKEMEIIANFEFEQKYFFTRKDIKPFFEKEQQMNDFIFGLKKKSRIIRINRSKYYLIPIKARSGGWSEHAYIIADEICNGKEYFIGGWAAAKYWGLTEQIPVQIDIYTTRRQGKYKIMNTRFVFHRTTKQKINTAINKEVEKHRFIILNKEDAKKWMKQRK
jgi:predicted transcriptional regulator of viral defense system